MCIVNRIVISNFFQNPGLLTSQFSGAFQLIEQLSFSNVRIIVNKKPQLIELRFATLKTAFSTLWCGRSRFIHNLLHHLCFIAANSFHRILYWDNPIWLFGRSVKLNSESLCCQPVFNWTSGELITYKPFLSLVRSQFTFHTDWERTLRQRLTWRCLQLF